MVSELRVAIDLDGTVADLSAAMFALARKHFPPNDDSADAVALDDARDRPALRDLGLSASQQQGLWSRALKTKNFWTTLNEMEPDVVRRIASLAAERRWDVLFITTRPTATGATTQVQSQEWLAAHGFERPSVYVIQGSRGRVAAALQLDVVVDDRPENCLDVALESAARAILIWPEDQREPPVGVVRSGVMVVPTIAAALDELVAIDRARSPSVMKSLKRLLGRA